MGIYAGLKRRHVAPGSRGGDGLPPSKRAQYRRVSAFASTDTHDERVRRQMDGWRQFTDNTDRKFVADATLRVPYGNLTQVAGAMRSGSQQPETEGFTDLTAQPVMVRSNRYEVLPDWMSRMQVFRSDPVTKQRLADLHHDGEARRLQVEATPSKRISVSKRMSNPQLEGMRELEPFSARAPYERNLKPDRTPMRDESTLPHTSVESHEIPTTMAVHRTSDTPAMPLRRRNQASHDLLPDTVVRSTSRVASNNTGFLHRVMNSLVETFLPGWNANRTPDVTNRNVSHKQRVSANLPSSNVVEHVRVHDASRPEMFHHHHHSVIPDMNLEEHNPMRPWPGESTRPHHVQRSAQDEDTAQVNGGHHRPAVRPETKVKPLPEGFAKVADVLDVSSWLVSRNAIPTTASHQTNLQATWTTEQQTISGARPGMERSSTHRPPSTRAATADAIIPSVENKNGTQSRQPVTIRNATSYHYQQPQAAARGTEAYRAPKVQYSMATAATSVDNQSRPLPRTDPSLSHHPSATRPEVSAVGEIQWAAEPIHTTPPTSNRMGREAFHAAMATGNESTPTATNSGVNGMRLQSVPRASSTSTEHPYQPNALLYDERIAGADEKTDAPPRPQWQDRVAPFATHLGTGYVLICNWWSSITPLGL